MATTTEPTTGPDVTVVALVAAIGAFATAVVAAVVRAFVSGWYPVGDNALFAIRGRDVLTEHHPLIGTSTSASEIVGINFNNPGPLLFDVFAVPAKLGPGFLPLGVAAVVVGSVAAMTACAYRVGGRRGALVALFSATALAWAMGPELLIDPWQPHSLLFPFLALIGATWAVWAGSDGAIAVSAALASLLLQTHLSYAPLIAALTSTAALVVVVRAVRQPARRPHARRILVLTVGLLAVLWAQPLVEQVTADDQGNLARIAEVPGADRGESLGLPVAIRVAGTLVSPLPRWAPPSFVDAYEQLPLLVPIAERFERLPSTPVAAATLVGTFLVLAAAGAAALRRGAPAVAAGAGVVGLTALAAIATAALLPIGLWGLPAHHVRWMWPVAIGVTSVVAAAAVARRAGVVVVGVATVAMGLLATTPTHPDAGPAGATDVAASAMRDLADDFDDAALRGPLLLETGPLAIDDQYTVPVIDELDRRVGVRLADPVLIRQLGDDRAVSGAERGRVVVRRGDEATEGPPGFERIGSVVGLSREERDELDRLTELLSSEVRGDDLRLTERGRAHLGAIGMPPLEEVVGRDVDPIAVLGEEQLWGSVVGGFVVAPERQVELERWTDLWRRLQAGTVSVWLDRTGG